MKLVAFAARDYPLALKKHFNLTDLAEIPLVVRGNRFRRGTTEMFLRELKRQGYRPKIAMVCDSPEAIKLAVSERMRAGILYYDEVKQAIARGAFKRLDIADLNLEKETFVLYRKERLRSQAAAEFLKLLRRWRDRRINRKPKGRRAVKRLPPLTYKPELRAF